VNEAVQFVVESQFANRDTIKHFSTFRLVNRRESPFDLLQVYGAQKNRDKYA
jgi:hypothetical protein